jgi:TAP-like protein
VIGDLWTTINMPCSNWDLRAAWKCNKTISADSTSYPILWLSNTRDPVTPLRNAQKMSKKFPGSVVFGQDGDGHCTIASPSSCTIRGIRSYFQGTGLPEGIVCKPDVGLFGQPIKGAQTTQYSEQELRISRELGKLAERTKPSMFPLGI